MNQLKKYTHLSAFPSFLLFIIFILINSIISKSFSLSFFESFLSTNMPALCVAVGVSATLLVKGTDISLGSIVSLVNVVIVILSGKGVPIEYAAILGLLVGVLCGMLNGLIVSVVRINPLLTTFSTSIIFSGIALWILPYPGGNTPTEFSIWYMGKVFNFIPTPLFLLLILILIWTFCMKLPLGKHLYALGCDEKKAYFSGIKVGWIKFFVHSFAGLSAGIAGLGITANICAGSPLIGSSMSMNSIASAVIGGVSLNGGIGSIWGGIFGSSFLNILTSIVVGANLSSYIQGFIQGLILLIGVIFSVIALNRSNRSGIKKKIKGEINVKKNK